MVSTTTILAVLLASGSPAHAADADSANGNPTASCDVDRERLLSLDEQAFDQDLSGGWRTIVGIPGCELAAADLIRDYRDRHASSSGTLLWHEGQLRANAGQAGEAVPLMRASRRPEDGDRVGWNHYVDATVAFLQGDRAALLAARKRLAAMKPSPDMTPVADGFVELALFNGQVTTIPWPMNLDVVDGLVHCFGQDYTLAYGVGCRTASPVHE